MSKKIPYEIVKNLLELNILVYKYGDTFKFNENQTLEHFLSNYKNENINIEDFTLNILKELNKDSYSSTIKYFIDDKDSDIQVGITINDIKKRLCVIFRGSESRKDLFYDIMFIKKNLGKGVRVHRGFYKQLYKNNTFNKLYFSLFDLLRKNPDYEIYITGHSLGGALSILFGYELSLIIPDNIKIISFASPRVGNYYFKKSFENQSNLYHCRIVNNKDIVTSLPMINYFHTGDNICLYNNNIEFKKNSEIKWWRYLPFYCYKISDHYVKNYYKVLKNNIW